jgi:MYXO-CTERM domain-containing protein
MRLLGLSLLVAVPAFAGPQDEYESTPQELIFSDKWDAFKGVEYDTGSLPKNSPLSVRFFIRSKGGSLAEIEADSQVTWPDSLTHSITGIDDGGYFYLLCDLELAARVQLDLWGYKGSYDVWAADLELEAEHTFSGLLLDGSSPRSINAQADGDGIDPYKINIPLVAGISLQLNIGLFPRATGKISGSRITTNDANMTREGVSTLLDVPEFDPGVLELTSTYVAQIDTALNVVIQPELQVCAPILGCFRVARFDIPIPLANASEERDFDTVDYEHPLPAMQAPLTVHDFGKVDVESLANLQLPLTNIGRLDLEGWIHIEGDGAFTVYPEYIHASEGNTDGTVVTFAPTSEGTVTATLVIESNDPSRPELRIPLAGNGWVEPPLEDPDDPSGHVSGEVGCGCSSTSSSTSFVWLFGVPMLALLRRRERR